MAKRGAKAVHHEPLKVLCDRYRSESQLLSIEAVTGSYVAIMFAGVYEEFRYERDELVRVDNGLVLTPTDSRVLFELANDARTAVIAGYAGEMEMEEPDDEGLLFPAEALPRIPPKTKRRKKRRPQIRKPETPGVRDLDTIDRARTTRLYVEYYARAFQEGARWLHVVRVRSDICVVRHLDTEHQFVFEHALAKHVDTTRFIPRNDFAFLCAFAEMLMNAAFLGYKLSNPEARKKQQKEPQFWLQLFQSTPP